MVSTRSSSALLLASKRLATENGKAPRSLTANKRSKTNVATSKTSDALEITCNSRDDNLTASKKTTADSPFSAVRSLSRCGRMGSALLRLNDIDDLIPVTLLHRPSTRNRSPYVADVLVACSNGLGSTRANANHDSNINSSSSSSSSSSSAGEKEEEEQRSEGREAICHVPNLDMGGKCVSGADLLVKPARDRRGNLVGADAVNPKYGTPKCEFIAQLLKVDETGWGYAPPCWVGAHPSLGERIAEQLLLRNCLHPHLPKIKSLKREVRNVGGSDMRADFLIEFDDEKPCVLEVKTVVDTDYAADRPPTRRTKCVFFSDKKDPYERAAIFPWGESKQKGPDGERVVSARAIKHVRELTRIARSELTGPDGETWTAAVLFVIIRKDAEYFRPNAAACPSFVKYLQQAKDAGVRILAKRVDWGDDEQTLGQCFEGPLLDIEWPTTVSGPTSGES